MSETTFKIPAFDGKEEKFSMWWQRFKAFAALKRFIQAIQDTPEQDLPDDETVVLDQSNEKEKLMIAARERNATAMAALTMAFVTPKLMMIVKKASNSDWPGGLAYIVVQELFKRY